MPSFPNDEAEQPQPPSAIARFLKALADSIKHAFNFGKKEEASGALPLASAATRQPPASAATAASTPANPTKSTPKETPVAHEVELRETFSPMGALERMELVKKMRSYGDADIEAWNKSQYGRQEELLNKASALRQDRVIDTLTNYGVTGSRDIPSNVDPDVARRETLRRATAIQDHYSSQIANIDQQIAQSAPVNVDKFLSMQRSMELASIKGSANKPAVEFNKNGYLAIPESANGAEVRVSRVAGTDTFNLEIMPTKFNIDSAKQNPEALAFNPMRFEGVTRDEINNLGIAPTRQGTVTVTSNDASDVNLHFRQLDRGQARVLAYGGISISDQTGHSVANGQMNPNGLVAARPKYEPPKIDPKDLKIAALTKQLAAARANALKAAQHASASHGRGRGGRSYGHTSRSAANKQRREAAHYAAVLDHPVGGYTPNIGPNLHGGTGNHERT